MGGRKETRNGQRDGPARSLWAQETSPLHLTSLFILFLCFHKIGHFRVSDPSFSVEGVEMFMMCSVQEQVSDGVGKLRKVMD